MASLDIRVAHRQAQAQTLSPRLQHAVRLLQMSSLDFAAMLRETLGRNPFLEVEEGDDGEGGDADATPPDWDDAPPSSLQDALAPQAAPADPADVDLDGGFDGQAAMHDDDSGVYNDGDGDRELWAADGTSAARGAGDGEFGALDLMAVDTPLNEHLHRQLNVLPLPARDLLLARAIVESLDDDGYLRTPLEELLDVTDLAPAADLQELQIALRRVQALEPAGVGARDVAECLLLQLPAIACADTRALAQTIITDHLPALAARDTAGLARRLRQPAARIEAACDRIRRLDPRPGWRIGSSQVAYVVPDVIVRKVRGQWRVQLNPAVVPRVRINQVYEQLFQRHRTPANAELGEHLQEARWTLRNVEQRFSTILDVAEAIVKRQQAFLDYGPMAMKPLGLKEIADEVGVHESTVSRVTNNKYMATPVGVLELKSFFSRAMISANGSACSGTAIRSLVKDIIEAESPDAPLSDAEITRQLAQQGLVVARRTVTKYRQMLKIDAVERRRRAA